MQRHLPFALLPLVAATATAQAWQLVANHGFTPEAMVLDGARGRIVRFSHSVRGATIQEWAGDHWLPGNVPGGPATTSSSVPRLWFDTVRRETGVHVDGTTWYYNGARWLLAASNGPNALDQVASTHAFDPIRQVLVFHQSLYSLTHEWDGSSWRTIPGSIGAFPDQSPAIGFDPVRQQIVATLPRLLTAWTWNGQTWTQIVGASVPFDFPQSDSALCVDPGRNRLVLFGGTRRPGSSPIADDALWVFDGTGWTPAVVGLRRRRTTIAPEPGTGTLLIHGGDDGLNLFADTRNVDAVFTIRDEQPCLFTVVGDPTHARIVGLGCSEGSPTRNRTFTWNGAAWQQLLPPQDLPALLVHDATRDEILAIENNFSLPHMRTWRLTATGWQLRPTATPPGWQPNWTACHDPVRQVVVLFGALGGTWQWNGTDWQPRPTAHGPTVAWNTTMLTAAFDPTVQRVRMLVRTTANVNEEWEWDGTDWTQTFPSGMPAVTWGRLAFDPVAQTMVFCGQDLYAQGNTPGTWERLGNAWVRIDTNQVFPTTLTVDPLLGRLVSMNTGVMHALRADAAASSRYGTGCGAGLVPTLTALGRANPFAHDLLLELGSAPANAPAAIYASLQAGNVPLVGGCTLLLGDVAHFAALTTSGDGVAAAPLAIPDSAALVGLDVYWQAIVLQTNGPLHGAAALSNGLRTHVGH